MTKLRSRHERKSVLKDSSENSPFEKYLNAARCKKTSFICVLLTTHSGSRNNNYKGNINFSPLSLPLGQ